MMNHLKASKTHIATVRHELHMYATQRANPRKGAGIASVDIHAWLLTLALAFLLRDDPYGMLPLEVTMAALIPQVADTGHTSASNGSDFADCMHHGDRLPGASYIFSIQ